MVRRFILVFAALAPVMLHAAPAQPPVTLDDFYRLAEVADPAFSPDGTSIAYNVTLADRARDESTSDLWVAPWRGGATRQLTKTAASSEWRPQYSADGRWIFFLSDATTEEKEGENAGKEKAEDTQLWRMPAAGGKAKPITSLPGGVSDFSLSPDGKHAVVVAESGRAVGSKAKNPLPIEIDRYLFKEDGAGYLDDRTRQLFVADLGTGKMRQLTGGLRDHWHPVWSPDGRWIAYTAKDRGDADRTLNWDVFIVAPDGAAPRRISTSPGADDEPDWEARPEWSPDSRRLLWLEGGEDKWIYYAAPQLAVAEIASGAITRPARIDRWFYKPQWLPDGDILATVEQDRDTWPARIDAATGTITYLTQGSRFATATAVSKQGRIVLLDADSRTPAELVAIDGSGKTRALTHHNAWLAGRALGEVRDISFKSGDTEIHGYVTLPAEHDPAKRYPLIADLHGGPVYQHSHEFDIDARLLAAAGYAVLAINPRGSSGRGFDFSRAIYADWGNLDAKDISAGISEAVAKGIADPARIGVGGWSYGGILTNYMIASDKRIKAAVSGAGVANVLATWGVDMYSREYLLELGTPWDNFDTYRKLAYPFFEASRVTAPTLFQCAGADDNVPCPGAQQMYLALKTRGIPTKLIVYPGENHALEVPSYLVHRMKSNIAWYDRWLK